MLDNIEKMVFNTNYSVERLTVEAPCDDSFLAEAAQKIAAELLANGCLLHRTEYDLETDKHREIVLVMVAKRKRTLP